MSSKPPVTGRVQSIKSKFENLNSFESLDISSSCDIQHHQQQQQHFPEPQPRTSFLFKRSATSLELPAQKYREKLLINSRRHLNVDKFALRNRNVRSPDVTANDDDGDGDDLKPLKEMKENVEIRLQRHTADPIKRGSIKRSPAFRVGEKSAKNGVSTTTSKSNSASTSSASSPVAGDEQRLGKFDDLLRQCSTDTEKLQEIGLTDTLKAVLKQPLPTGPPPKKPPRTFAESPSPRDSHQPAQLFARATAKEVTAAAAAVATAAMMTTSSTTKKSMSPPKELQNKINFLENELVLKAHGRLKNGGGSSSTKHSKPFSVNLLKCIPCSSAPIYDTMTISQMSLQQKLSPGARSPTKSITQSLDKPKKNVSEPIYMEPFAHLKLISNNNHLHHHHQHQPLEHRHSNNIASFVPETNGGAVKRKISLPFSYSNTSVDSVRSPNMSMQSPHSHNGSTLDNESIASSHISCTSCAADDHSLSDLSGDIHYMCTSIEDKPKSSDTESTSTNENEPVPLMPSNTYDEINILVNAAFGQHSATDSMVLGMDNMDTLSTTSSSSASGTTQQKNATKLYRTLTEKRKDYVRRVSEVKPMNDASANNSYGSLHRTFKSSVFKTFSFDNDHDEAELPPPSIVSDRITQFSRREQIANEKSKCHTEVTAADVVVTAENVIADAITDVDAPKLFQVCLLIGYDNSNRSAYIKWKYPPDEDVPDNIEQLVFPSRNMLGHNRSNQDYSLILTDQNGYHVYGYCRRVVPESCEICFPLAYCVISELKAPGFYFKLLKEIESRHGQSEVQTDWLLHSLQNQQIPDAGKFLHLKLPMSPRPKTIRMSNHKITPKRLSIEVNPKWLTESAAQAAFSNLDDAIMSSSSSTSSGSGPSKKKSLLQEFEEKKQEKQSAPFDLSLISRSQLGVRNDEIFITRPNDLRLESTELSDLYRALGPDLLITVFSSLLLERKVVLFTENISILSSCVLGLQTLLYPFQWQYTLVTVLPQDLAEICQAPTPVLAGMLESIAFDIEDGIVINLDNRNVTQKCGDEKTILPNSLSESLRISLDMVDLLNQGKMLSSVLIAEAFVRFFVELFLGYKHKHFDKKLFIESHSSQTYRLFLEWFVETAMFRHFIHEKYTNKGHDEDVGATTNSAFYDYFDARVLEKSQMKSNSTQQNMENIMKNCRIINGKAKTFKERFRNFLSSNSSGSNSSSSNN